MAQWLDLGYAKTFNQMPAMIEVVIPAYNAAPFLRETLLSVAAQTLLPAQVTVVDDRSTDGTAQIAEACAEELRDRIAIRVLCNTGPRGPSAGRNTAIRASTAEWIALLDSDDVLLPEHHATLASIARAPATVLAFGDCCLFQTETGQTLVASHHAKSRLLELPAETQPDGGRQLAGSSFAALLRGPRIPTSACLLRREAVLTAGLFDESMVYAEDADLFMRLAWLGGVVFTERKLTRKRVHASNLSREDNRVQFTRGDAVSATKLLMLSRSTNPAPFCPGQGDQAVCEEIAPRAINAYLYDASRKGFAAYATAVRLAWQYGFGTLALKPRHLARMLLMSWKA